MTVTITRLEIVKAISPYLALTVSAERLIEKLPEEFELEPSPTPR